MGLLKGDIDRAPLQGIWIRLLKRDIDMDVDVEVDVDIDRYFGCEEGGSTVSSGTAEWYRSNCSIDFDGSEIASPDLHPPPKRRFLSSQLVPCRHKEASVQVYRLGCPPKVYQSVKDVKNQPPSLRSMQK